MSNPPPNPPDDAADAALALDGASRQRKLWRAGTLTYTTGGLVILFSWLLWGDFAWSMPQRSTYPVVQLLLKKFGASDTVLALVLSTIPLAVGVLFGPIVSYRSDRHRGRWGRRIPYILVTTPIAALSMVGLAFSAPLGGLICRIAGIHPPQGPDTPSIIVFGTFYVIFSFAAGVTSSVYIALTNDVVPKEFLGRFFALFRVFSLLAGIIFNWWLMGAAETHSGWLFVGIALLYGVSVMLMCLRVKEGEYPPPPAVGEAKTLFAAVKKFFVAARGYFKECFSNPYYRWLFAALTVSELSFVPINLYAVVFARSLGMTMGRYGKYTAVSFIISFCLAYVIGMAVDRFHPLRVSIGALVIYAVTVLLGGLYATTPPRFGIALVAYIVMSGTCGTASASLPQRLFPHSTFAQFASATTLLISLSSLALSPIIGVWLDLTGHVYRQTFLIGFGFSVAAVILMLVVHTRFMRLGGPENYTAPE